MAFNDKMKEMLDQGLAVSKDLAAKAGAKAQDLGERGVLMLEIKQLESQAQKLIGSLGAEVYQIFSERGEETLSKDSAPIKTLLADIAAVRNLIDRKDADLKERKKA